MDLRSGVLQLKVLMVRSGQKGFSLIELMFVMAITSLMLVSVIAGQRALRSRAQFDAAVNRVVASATQARSQANSAVNISSSTTNGTGIDKCPGPAAPAASGNPPFNQYTYVGTEWIARSTTTPTVTINSWKGLPGSAACVFSSENIVMPSKIWVTSPAPNGGRALFIRDDSGVMHTCTVANVSSAVDSFFAGAPCSNTPLTFVLTDEEGHTANLEVDETGIARRD